MKNALNEYLHLVAIYQHEGNLEQANAFLKNAAMINPNDPDYLEVKNLLKTTSYYHFLSQSVILNALILKF